ncbi:MAG: hypothetical protein FD129_1478 [bacterium]|nr:MAG: hypothetical protein FD129_1478 [bacterium]
MTSLQRAYVVLKPITTAPAGFLETAAAMDGLVRFNILLLFLGGALSVGISAAVWPVVRERGYRLGLWMLALAAANFTLQLIENAHWLTMLSVSHAYADADAAGAEAYRPIGIAVRSAWRWAHYSHILVVVGWFFALYAALFRSRVMPRALSAAGMATCGLHFVGITLPIFAGYRMPLPMLFGMPLGVATLAAAIWLMAKGFEASSPALTQAAPGVGRGNAHV